MPKGIFTQCACILLEQPVALDAIEAALDEYTVRGTSEPGLEEHAWVFGGPSVTVEFDAERNGMAVIDVVDRVWPDQMGDSETEIMLFGGWSMGQFGPFTYPGGLERAGLQSWSWEEAADTAAQHHGFIRIRSSYALGVEDDKPIMPSDYDPMIDLEFVTKLVSSLLSVSGSLCYFNPNGEVLLDEDGLRENLNYAWANDLPPLNVWANIRLFNVNADWVMMDTVGNGQLDVPDIEACCLADEYELGEIDSFLRNVTDYLMKNGEVINDGDTMDGPGDVVWQAKTFENGLTDPPRRVLSWLPLDDRPVPDEILTRLDSD